MSKVKINSKTSNSCSNVDERIKQRAEKGVLKWIDVSRTVKLPTSSGRAQGHFLYHNDKK